MGRGIIPKKILIIEDEPDFAKALRIRLQDSGYFVMTACDAIQAVSKVSKEKPDLIILDIRIPAGGGFAVAEKVKRSTYTCSIPIIFLTASSDEADEKRAMRLGALFYFHKPMCDAEFLEAVRSALESKLQIPNKHA